MTNEQLAQMLEAIGTCLRAAPSQHIQHAIVTVAIESLKAMLEGPQAQDTMPPPGFRQKGGLA